MASDPNSNTASGELGLFRQGAVGSKPGGVSISSAKQSKPASKLEYIAERKPYQIKNVGKPLNLEEESNITPKRPKAYKGLRQGKSLQSIGR